MDAHQLQMQVLSDAGLENTPPAQAIPQAKATNDQLLALIQAHPTRFDEFPHLKIMLGHWGELVSFYMHRLDETIMPTHPHIDHDISTYFHRNLYVSPSGLFDQHQLEWAVAEFGADHVMFSTDYPYEPFAKIGTFLADSTLSAADQQQIGSQTGRTILHL